MNKSESDNWDIVAGNPPNRSGARRIVSAEEGCTPYTGGGWYREDLCGVQIEIGTDGMSESETTTYISVQPHNPSRPDQAARSWMLRQGFTETNEWDDLYDKENTDKPLPGYQPETTGDHRSTNIEDPRGDGVYERDGTDNPLTAQIADIVTRNGGRIPVQFRASVQNEGYARSRQWNIYAPQSNPYHIAAAVTDLLQETDGITEVNVSVDTDSGADLETELRQTGFGHIFDYYGDTDEAHIKRMIREVRWISGLPQGRRTALAEVPTDARQKALDNADTDRLTDISDKIWKAVNHPGDAWEYCQITIRTHEEAQEPYYG
jgi:hypothetical protein